MEIEVYSTCLFSDDILLRLLISGTHLKPVQASQESTAAVSKDVWLESHPIILKRLCHLQRKRAVSFLSGFRGAQTHPNT